MIRLQVSAALAVRDGFTGRPIARNTVRCFVDGQPFRPEYRQGGYLVFVNLEPGEHRVLLRGSHYLDEHIRLETRPGVMDEKSITLKPAPNYPFYHAVTQLIVRYREKSQPISGHCLWVSARAAMEDIKIAQDMAEAGSTSARVYFRGGEEGRFPRNYLILDGKKSEIVHISGCEGGCASFDKPLGQSHKRGVALYPAQAYHTDEKGEILAFFRAAVPVELFDPLSNRLTSLDLETGRNEAELV